jgi:hypothetical protein
MMVEMKAPEFTGYWFDDETTQLARALDEESLRAEQEALDELADRVTAARSVL